MDETLIQRAKIKFADQQRLRLINANFGTLPKMRVGQLSRNKFDFILADLGYNNEQLERVDGLSYTRSGLLDMRYSQKQPRTAASLLSSMSVLDLATVLRDYSDIRDPQKIAERVLGARPSTAEALVEVLSRGGEPQWNLVAKVFQALRMVVNSELTNLKNLVEGCKQWLGPDGLAMVIGFSSLEHKVAKRNAMAHGFKVVQEQNGDGQANAQERSARLIAFSMRQAKSDNKQSV